MSDPLSHNQARKHQLIVVFDTNAYIAIGDTVLGEIIAAEAKVGVLALASVWPSLELLARCAGSDIAKANRAHIALRRIAAHAGYEDSSGRRIRVHEAGELALARGLFNLTPEEPLLEIGFVGDLLVAAATNPIDALLDLNATELQRVADRVQQEKESFTRMVAVGMTTHATPDRTRTPPSTVDLAIVAAGLVQTMAERYGVALNSRNAGHYVNSVVHNFPVALAFVYGLISDSTASQGVAGGGNSAWDLKIAFHAARGGSISGIPVLLVSDDRRLLRAAREAGDGPRVARTTEYRSLISDLEQVAERSDRLRRGFRA